MSSYRLVNSGKKQRREYFSLNRSPLFQALPERDFAQEQKASYRDFLDVKLPKLLTFYFPFEFSDYNNDVWMSASEVEYQESSSEEEARINSSTWSYLVSFNWKVSWNCHKIQIQLLDNDLKKSINQWVEESFKIKKFTCKKKSSNKWEVKEIKGSLKIVLEVLEEEEDKLIVKFHCGQDQRVDFCHLPKMTQQGNFIINGHDKVVVFQSVRAPSIYFFNDEKNKLYGEIIPFKGPWISVYYSAKKPRSIELKFLNSKLVINLLNVFKTFNFSPELLEKIFDSEELNIEDYQETKPLEVGISRLLPRFLFVEKNSYFDLGKLGRKKYNQEINIFKQAEGQTLANDLYDSSQKLILKKNSVLTGKNLQVLKNALKAKKMPAITIPHATNSLYLIKIKSPQDPAKVLSVVGIAEDLSEEKTYFDLADLICSVSNYINLHHGLGKIEKEEEKDDLKNQIVRRVGDLIYNLFENKLGGFLQNIGSKYVTNYLSQLKKVDLAKIADLKIFDNLLRDFFNNSPLVQLQNQNNPLSEISYARKLSVLGLGGFGTNTTLNARNINSSYYGRYDLVETPEGQKIGLIHNLTIGAEINAYGQIVLPCYLVENGIVTPQLDYLTSEEEWDKYITHCNIKIDEKNRILEEEVSVRYQGDFKRVPKEKVNYIDSSFYHLNSVTSATIPFFQHNDATRMLMSSNMQRQAVTLLKSEAPLVASGLEATLLNNSPLVIRAEGKGKVEYVDNQQIVIKEGNKEEKSYKLRQLAVSNKNILNFSFPLVKKGEKVEKGQMIGCGNYADQGELALGYNLRVAYLCWNGYNYEDAIVVSDRLVKENILTSLLVKKYKVIRYNTKYGPEVFTPSPHSFPLPHLDKNGLVKVGSKVKGDDVLIGKQTPEPPLGKETEEEMLLLNILGKKAQKFVNSSLVLPAGDEGTVYAVETKELTGSKNELELVEVYVFFERKLEVGDKLTTRFGNKGVVAKIVPESDMPFDEEGRTIDIIFNPLGVPTRLNLGQLLETILGCAARKLNTQFLFRTFNTPSFKTIKEIIEDAGIKNYGSCKLFDGQTGLPFQLPVYSGYIYVVKVNHMVADKFHARNTGPRSLIYQQPLKGRAQKGGQRIGEMEGWVLMALGANWNLMEMMGPKSDDIYKLISMQKNLIFGDRQTDLRSSQSESFNLLLQYLRGIGFDLQATDYQGREIDFYESFSYNIDKKKK